MSNEERSHRRDAVFVSPLVLNRESTDERQLQKSTPGALPFFSAMHE
jgi:hypothetical protein